MLILTWSSINKWRECRRKFMFEYFKLIVPIGVNINFYIGTLIHKMVNLFHIGNSVQEVVNELENYSEAMLEVHLMKQGTSSEDEERMRDANELVGVIAEAYDNHYMSKYPEPIAIEKIYEYEILPGIIFKGKIDEIVQQKKKKHLYEIKSTKSIDNTYVSKYVSDGQTMSYVILADVNGIEISKVWLDCIKKPQIRQGKNEPRASYYTRLFTLYDERAVDHFYTNKYPLSNRMIKEHLRSLKISAAEIAHAYEKGNSNDFPIDARSCFIYGKCAYHSICKDGDTDEIMAMYTEKSAMHEELVEESDD